MSEGCDTPVNDSERFPDLHPADLKHLQEQYHRYGRERVLGWLKTKVAIPLRYQFDDEFDEEDYWDSAVDHYVDTDMEPEDSDNE